MSLSGRRLFLILSVCFAWVLISAAPLWKYLSHAKAAVALGVGLLCIALAMDWLDRRNRSGRQIHILWLVLVLLALTTAFAVLYPASLKHDPTSRSDREDALRIELVAVRHHQYPYQFRTFRGNLPTPLPGAMLLAAPFFAIGHIAWQNLLWYALFFLFCIFFFRYRATALFYLVLFLLFAPANFSDFTSGGDYLTNFFYVAIALGLFIRSLGRSLYASVSAALFLGVTISSRDIYAIVLVPLLALTFQRTSRGRATVLLIIILLAASAVTLPIFAPHPLAHLLQQLDQNAIKLRYIPQFLHPRETLPLLAFAISCIAFFLRMDLPRLFLIFSIAAFVMLAPFVITFALVSEKLWFNFSYLSIASLSVGLWALSRYEQAETYSITGFP
jgi:hypothetical protein